MSGTLKGAAVTIASGVLAGLGTWLTGGPRPLDCGVAMAAGVLIGLSHRPAPEGKPLPSGVDVYAVGFLRDLRQFTRPAPRRTRRLLRALRYPFRQVRRGNWRAVRNYFNGYLAEPYQWPPGLARCGSGWTHRRALRDLAAREEASRG